MTAAAGEQAICFLGGRASQSLGYTVQPELCRLPYPVCWIEFEIPEGPTPWRCFVLATELKGVRRAVVYGMDTAGWSLWGCATVDGWTVRKVGFVAGSDEAGVLGALSALAGFLSALNCRNVRQVSHKPDANRQRMRERQGKPPLFSYWTLQLGSAGPNAPYQGGTHARPRVHLRRGHPRQYAPGQWTWVQPHAVGSPSRGLVHKDYESAFLTAGPGGEI